MAAVIGPVGVHHPDSVMVGVPVLVVPEVGLEEFQVVQVHGQPQLVQQLGKGRLVQSGEAGDGLHGGGGPRLHGGYPASSRPASRASTGLMT